MSRYSITVLLAMILSSATVAAQAPDSISFQGRITKTLGELVDSSNVSITFTLYKGSTDVWHETQVVDVDSGVFNVYLGAVAALDTVAFSEPMDLGIKLDGEASEISPRTPLVAGAFALGVRAFHAWKVEGAASSRGYNIVAGAENNHIEPDVIGGTISGGGGTDLGTANMANTLDGNFAVIAGGGQQHGYEKLCCDRRREGQQGAGLLRSYRWRRLKCRI